MSLNFLNCLCRYLFFVLQLTLIAHIGTFSILVPRVHQTQDQFAIVLECRDADMRFHAKYEIPSSEYKEHKKGATVRIEEDWTPIEFQVL